MAHDFPIGSYVMAVDLGEFNGEYEGFHNGGVYQVCEGRGRSGDEMYVFLSHRNEKIGGYYPRRFVSAADPNRDYIKEAIKDGAKEYDEIMSIQELAGDT